LLLMLVRVLVRVRVLALLAVVLQPVGCRWTCRPTVLAIGISIYLG
jgi:hypothetical protein